MMLPATLVIGGNGFIGGPLLEALRAKGVEAFAMHRVATDVSGDVVGAREDVRRVVQLVRSLGIRVVVDLLAYSEASTTRLLDALSGRIDRYVLISSCDVYRNYGGLHRNENPAPYLGPADENAPLRRVLYPYRNPLPRPPEDPERWLDDYDKIPIERSVRKQAGFEWTILRLPMVFGPGDRQRRFAWIIRPMADRRPWLFVESEVAQWCTTYGYVEDVAAAIALSALHPKAAGKIYNLGYPDWPTQREMIARFAAHLEWHGEVIEVADGPLPGRDRYARLHFDYPLMVDSRRIRDELGFTEVTGPWHSLHRTIADELAYQPPPGLEQQYAAEDRRQLA
jgi:nucleoside-diphosphate-sugar epimerase